MKKLHYQGSVKDIYSSEDKFFFKFSNRYSIYDWGEMPDKIPSKGKYLNEIACYFFEYLAQNEVFSNLIKPDFINEEKFKQLQSTVAFSTLAKEGLKTHFIAKTKKNEFSARKFNVLRPHKNGHQYSYTQYKSPVENTLVPLEVIFRLGAPLGSSILKRDQSEIKKHYGIKEIKEGELFDNIIIEFSTKLEPIDRMLSHQEAKDISGMNQEEFDNLINTSKAIALSLYNKFSQVGFKLWDGKFEFSFGNKIEDNRELILVDSIGPDELRLTKDDIPFSKEILRQFYQESAWLNELESFKKLYNAQFRLFMNSKPFRLSNEQLKISKYIYKSIAFSLNRDQKYAKEKRELALRKYYQTVVVFGKGGREHALATKLSHSKKVKRVYVIPGNPGINSSKIKSINIAKNDYISFCLSNKVDLAVIGPENLLEAGLCDELRQNDINAFGPSQKASILESSKAFSKDLMQKYNIPTASYKTFNDYDLAKDYILDLNFNKIVIKQSSLAAGKGVFICESVDQAIEALNLIFTKPNEVVIEEFLEGREVSFFALCSGTNYQVLGHACDYKRLNDKDHGPNTGGMGCYAPADWLKQEEIEYIKSSIVTPTLEAMKKEGRSFQGVLFIGLMQTQSGIKVLEYNVRFGDPETQALLPIVTGDFYLTLKKLAQGKVCKNSLIEIKNKKSIHIVKASKGYPGINGEVIEDQKIINNDLLTSPSLHLYFAGIDKKQDQLITNGGRVLGVTAISDSKESARVLAYENINKVNFQGEHFRGDIGQ